MTDYPVSIETAKKLNTLGLVVDLEATPLLSKVLDWLLVEKDIDYRNFYSVCIHIDTIVDLELDKLIAKQ